MSAPQSLFGGVPITLIRESGGAPADWTPDAQTVTFHFPGGNASEIQNLGQGPLTVDYLVRLESDVEFGAIASLLGTDQVMRAPRLATAFRGDREFQEHGHLYKEFEAVTLAAITDVQLRIGGTVLCRCAFSRSAGGAS